MGEVSLYTDDVVTMSAYSPVCVLQVCSTHNADCGHSGFVHHDSFCVTVRLHILREGAGCDVSERCIASYWRICTCKL